MERDSEFIRQLLSIRDPADLMTCKPQRIPGVSRLPRLPIIPPRGRGSGGGVHQGQSHKGIKGKSKEKGKGKG
jgi:hypothetical protein